MIVLSNFAAILAQKEDALTKYKIQNNKIQNTNTKYACLAQSEAQLGLALSAKENIST